MNDFAADVLGVLCVMGVLCALLVLSAGIAVLFGFMARGRGWDE